MASASTEEVSGSEDPTLSDLADEPVGNGVVTEEEEKKTSETAVKTTDITDVKKKTVEIESSSNSITSGINWKLLTELVILEGMCLSAQDILEEHLKDGTLVEDGEEWTQHKDLIGLIYARCSRAHEVIGWLTGHSGWTTQYEDWHSDVYNKKSEHIGIYYKKEKGTEIHSIKVRFIAESAMIPFFATINEFDLMENYIEVPGARVLTDWVEEISNVEKILWSKLELWWPLQNRDMLCHVDAFDSMYHCDSVILVGESLDTANLEKDTADSSQASSADDESSSQPSIEPRKTWTRPPRSKGGSSSSSSSDTTIHMSDAQMFGGDDDMVAAAADSSGSSAKNGRIGNRPKDLIGALITEEEKQGVIDRVIRAFKRARRHGVTENMSEWKTDVPVDPKTIRLHVERGFGMLKPVFNEDKLREMAEKVREYDDSHGISEVICKHERITDYSRWTNAKDNVDDGSEEGKDDDDNDEYSYVSGNEDGSLSEILRKRREFVECLASEFEIDLVEVTAVFNVDFRSYLPKKLVNWMTRTFAYYVCKQVMTKCKELIDSDIHQTRIRTRDCYRLLEEKLLLWKMSKVENTRVDLIAELSDPIEPAALMDPTIASASSVLRAAEK